MRTIIKWIDIEEQKPEEGDECWVVSRPHPGHPDNPDPGPYPACVVAGTLRWVNGRWEHPLNHLMREPVKVRQDIGHWANAHGLRLIGRW